MMNYPLTSEFIIFGDKTTEIEVSMKRKASELAHTIIKDKEYLDYIIKSEFGSIDEVPDLYNRCLAQLEKGKTIYLCEVSPEGDPLCQYLYNYTDIGFEEGNKEYIIHNGFAISYEEE